MKVPTKYEDKTFYDKRILREFMRLSDKEKFEMAYWVEKQSVKRSSQIGFFLGWLFGMCIWLFFKLTWYV